MPKNPDIKKVLVIGSGPIVIGQAAEFDYAGTQACRSLKEEGLEVVLLNSNPATIMTDKEIADNVYIEPLTVEVLEQLIEKEQPDSVLPPSPPKQPDIRSQRCRQRLRLDIRWMRSKMPSRERHMQVLSRCLITVS